MKYGIRAKWLSRFATGTSVAEPAEAAVCDVSTAGADQDLSADSLPTNEGEAASVAAEPVQQEAVETTVSDDAVVAEEPVSETGSPVEVQREDWERDAAAVRQVYDGFDLAVERTDPRFMTMLQAGVPMLDAYRALHMEDILTALSTRVQAEAEKRMTEHVQARGVRPSENGTAGTQGLQLWQNVHQLTREKRAEIADRAHNGEQISFR